MSLVFLLGCPGVSAVVVTAPTDLDECAELCVTVHAANGEVGAAGAEVSVTLDGAAFGEIGTTDADGLAKVCGAAPAVGAHEVAALVNGAEAGEPAAMTVHAFGYADGFVRDEVAIDSLPWTPSFARVPGNPVLAPGEVGGWDGVAVALPSVVATDDGYTMWYAGSDGGDYVIGAATSPDGVAWTRVGDKPLLTGSGVEGDWKRYSVNSPMLVPNGDEWALFYDGRAEESGNINIGLAVGAAPTEVVDVPESPVFHWTEAESSWGGEAVAHPSVVINDQGFWELWYSTGLQKIGYAYSTDGRAWSRYCHNPVFVPDTTSTWENGTVKAAEVVTTADGYAMTYSGGGMGTFQLGWAMSRDGLHWQRAPLPILSPEGNDWENRAVLSAPFVVVGEDLWMWYTGTDGVGSSIGLAIANADASVMP